METAKELILKLQKLVNKFNTADMPIYVNGKVIKDCYIRTDYRKEQFCIEIITED